MILVICLLDKDFGYFFTLTTDVDTFGGILHADADDIFNDPDINLIVEVVDDASASYRIVTTALKKGLPVVSGSKAMIAVHLPELIELQEKHHTAMLSTCTNLRSR